MNEIFISVDIEASGPVPGTYSMLSIGACLVADTEQNFYIELQPINTAFVPAALEVTGKKLSDFSLKGDDPKKGMQKFKHWIDKVTINDTPVFVGFNTPFDWSFINWYFHTFLGENPFGISGIDIKAYYMGMTGCSWSKTKSSKIPAQFKGQTKHTHNALDDAIEQAEMFYLMYSNRH